MRNARAMAAVGLLALATGLGRAESLWEKDRAAKESVDPLTGAVAYASLYSDLVPFKREIGMHDIVTIVVQEATTATAMGKTDLQKDAKAQADIGQLLRLFRDRRQFTDVDHTATTPTDAKIDMQFKLDQENKGNTERRGSLLDRIAAEVIAKYPNGNLLLEARKIRQVNQETETITLRGMVRPQDIDRDNTVRSDRILRLEVHYDGDGPVNLAQRQGWFSRALDYLWPF